MKNLAILLACGLLSFGYDASYAQQYNGNTSNPSQVYGLFGFGVGSAPSSMMLGDAAVINAQANLVLSQSYANINYETAYAMRMDNNILRTQTFFQMRQINRYYRDLENWQKQERAMLKHSGLYDRESIEYIYNGVKK